MSLARFIRATPRPIALLIWTTLALSVIAMADEFSASINDPQYTALLDAIARNHGQLPSSLAQLKTAIGNQLTPLPVPDGRSLLKSKATFKNPRFLLADTDRKLFIGFVPGAHEAEIISANQKTGQNDFFILRKLAPGSKPELVPANRQVCVGCHQAGGPIFPGFPWTESQLIAPERSIGFKGNTLYRKLVSANGGTVIGGVDISKASNLPDPATFDDLVRGAAQDLQERRFCERICSDDVDCLQALLLASLSGPPKEGGTNVLDDYPGLKSRIEKLWPLDGFEQVSHILPDRDPTTGTYTRNFSIPSLGRHRTTDSQAALLQARQSGQAIEKTYEDPFSPQMNILTGPGRTHVEAQERVAPGSGADPSVPRPKIMKMRKEDAPLLISGSKNHTGAWSCFNLGTNALMQLSGKIPALDPARQGRLRSLLARWKTLRKDEILDALTGPIYPATDNGACPEKLYPLTTLPLTVDHETTVAMQAIQAGLGQQGQRALRYLKRYCTECHADDTVAKLPLEDLEALKKYKPKDGGRSIAERIRLKQMPNHAAKAQPTENERQDLIEVLHY